MFHWGWKNILGSRRRILVAFRLVQKAWRRRGRRWGK
ncbi:MAG: hypothetical protein MRERV_82c005 [Mycoplasmataceae bacterium RV_VA103A]|nr:MAG: hypothetical protein MRERV_82c005 [Mycoplasmataceae bacterium RV_VA103A]